MPPEAPEREAGEALAVKGEGAEPVRALVPPPSGGKGFGQKVAHQRRRLRWRWPSLGGSFSVSLALLDDDRDLAGGSGPWAPIEPVLGGWRLTSLTSLGFAYRVYFPVAFPFSALVGMVAPYVGGAIAAVAMATWIATRTRLGDTIGRFETRLRALMDGVGTPPEGARASRRGVVEGKALRAEVDPFVAGHKPAVLVRRTWRGGGQPLHVQHWGNDFLIETDAGDVARVSVRNVWMLPYGADIEQPPSRIARSSLSASVSTHLIAPGDRVRVLGFVDKEVDARGKTPEVRAAPQRTVLYGTRDEPLVVARA